jgi:glutathione S-transferase
MHTLFIANKVYSSWSLRPWILMRELAIPFDEKLVTFETDSSWESFRSFSPAGKVPCLHDGESVVWDSLAITEFLADRYDTISEILKLVVAQMLLFMRLISAPDVPPLDLILS